MQTIELTKEKNHGISKFFEFYKDLPIHGFKKFPKEKKEFIEEILSDLKSDKSKIFLTYSNDEKINNYFYIKNEPYLKRTIIMSYDISVIKNIYSNIKEFCGSNQLETGIRDSENSKNLLLKHIKTYDFMHLNFEVWNKKEKVINRDFYLEMIDHTIEIKKLVKIQNDCFADHHGYEPNTISGFKNEILNLKRNKIDSIFEVGMNKRKDWIGYSWTTFNSKTKEAKLSMCGVKKQFRSKGLAKPIIYNCIDNLIEIGSKSIILEVDSENVPAKKIYTEIGFEIYDKLKWYKVIF